MYLQRRRPQSLHWNFSPLRIDHLEPLGEIRQHMLQYRTLHNPSHLWCGTSPTFTAICTFGTEVGYLNTSLPLIWRIAAQEIHVTSHSEL